MVKSSTIQPVLRVQKGVGRNGATRIQYHDGTWKSVDVQHVEDLPSGAVLKVTCGHGAGGEILYVKRQGKSFLVFDDRAVRAARREAKDAREATKEKISSSA